MAALAAVALCLVAVGARAQSGKGDYVGTWSAAAGLGYAIPDTDEYENVPAWRLAVGYGPMPQLEIDLELGRFSSAVSQPDVGGIPSHTIASGQLDVRPVCITAQYRTPLPEMLSTLTLLAGVGYYFIDYGMDDTQRAAFAAGDIPGLPDQSVDDAWGFHLGAGLEYALTERFSVTAEGRYIFLSPQARGTEPTGNPIDGSLDLNTWLVTGGVKVAF